MTSSSATEASLQCSLTTGDKNSKEGYPIRNLWEIDCEDNNYNSIALLFHHSYTALLINPRILKEDRRKMLFSPGKIKTRTETKSCFYDSTLTVGCESLSPQSKYDKALHYCSDRSSFCHDLEMKILIIPLSNCHSISSS
jgi:hypothetical protein